MILKKRFVKSVDDILVYAHLLVIFFGVIMGLFFSFKIVLLLNFIHRLHFIAFGGCIISKIHHKLDTFSETESFIQFIFYKFSTIKISNLESKVIDYFLLCLSIGIAFIYI